MARRYRKYKRKKRKGSVGDESFFILVGTLVVAAGIFGVETDNAPLSLREYAPVIIFLITLVVVLFLVLFFLKRHLEKLKRGKFYRDKEVIEELMSMPPQQFEEYLAALYEQKGFTIGEVTRYSKDHGIDVILQKEGKKFAVQAKRFNKKNLIGERLVREFYGSYIDGGYEGGILVTTSSFTGPACEWARKRNIELVDGQILVTMMHKSEY